MKRLLPLLLLSFMIVYMPSTSAQQQNIHKEEAGFFQNLDYGVRVYFSIGGGVPLGIPQEVTSIVTYNPTFQFGIGANATKWFKVEPKWGLRLGAVVESKGMYTEAEVNQYLTEIIEGKQRVGGYFTGLVETRIKNTYVSIPLSLVYKVTPKVDVHGGLYTAYLIDQQFDGYVSSGYLRQDTPTGTKILFEEGASAAYDFSDQVRTFQWGMLFGADWKIIRNFRLISEFSYGFNGILKKDFEAISFSLYNISLNLGFAYKF